MPDRTDYRANLLAVLTRRELNRVAARLSDELRLAYVEDRPGEWIEGVYRRPVELASGRYALMAIGAEGGNGWLHGTGLLMAASLRPEPEAV